MTYMYRYKFYVWRNIICDAANHNIDTDTTYGRNLLIYQNLFRQDNIVQSHDTNFREQPQWKPFNQMQSWDKYTFFFSDSGILTVG